MPSCVFILQVLHLLLPIPAGAQDSLTPKQLADVVWQYFTQLGSSAEETVRQAQQLDITKQLR